MPKSVFVDPKAERKAKTIKINPIPVNQYKSDIKENPVRRLIRFTASSVQYAVRTAKNLSEAHGSTTQTLPPSIDRSSLGTSKIFSGLHFGKPADGKFRMLSCDAVGRRAHEVMKTFSRENRCEINNDVKSPDNCILDTRGNLRAQRVQRIGLYARLIHAFGAQCNTHREASNIARGCGYQRIIKTES